VPKKLFRLISLLHSLQLLDFNLQRGNKLIKNIYFFNPITQE
jgi:hypothetical protein